MWPVLNRIVGYDFYFPNNQPRGNATCMLVYAGEFKWGHINTVFPPLKLVV